ncbi:unnamed protein product [Symbiodinium sp. KB8]|nr:unnamed protein product [Symbiodinium sp. KB8]
MFISSISCQGEEPCCEAIATAVRIQQAVRSLRFPNLPKKSFTREAERRNYFHSSRFGPCFGPVAMAMVPMVPQAVRRAAGIARRRAPLLLVLDLDETLVRVCCKGVHHNRNLRVVDFRVPIEVGALPKATTFDCGVALRPGVERGASWSGSRSFMEWMFAVCVVVVLAGLRRDSRSCIQYWLLPERAPEWYRKLVLGTGGRDVHSQPPPKDSLPLLGHLDLTVPKLVDAKDYWINGLGALENYKESSGELWAHLGPSQIRMSEGSIRKWPGEIRVWVEDIRTVADMLNMLGRTLDTKLVAEMREATTGGEYAALLHDPGHVNKVQASEAPSGWAEAIRAIPSGLSGEVRKKNALALSEAVVLLPKREQIQGVARFYDHFIGSAITKKYQVYEAQALMDICMVHFAPGAKLHQTLTYKADKTAVIPGSLASVCIYLKDHVQFHLVYAKCKAAGILRPDDAKKSWEEVESAHEYTIEGVLDPQSHSMVIALNHVIRTLEHPECPLCQGLSATCVLRQHQTQAEAARGPWIYTTSTPNYTKALMRHVDPGGRVFAMRVLTREKCKPCAIPGFLLKEMSQIPSKHDADDATEQQLLQRRVLIDNSPVSCVLHPNGSVLVRDWLGEGTEDDELPRVQRLLEAVLEDDGESEADYAARLVRHTAGHGSWSARLKALSGLLESQAPMEADELRTMFRRISNECNDMKRELLGAAP